MKTLAFLARHHVAALLLLVLGAVTFLGVRDWYRGNPMQTIIRQMPVPVVAAPTPLLLKAKPEVVTRTVVRYLPAPKDAAKLEQRFHLAAGDLSGRELGKRDLLANIKIAPLPYGGESIVTQGRDGKTQVEVLTAARPFFELGGRRETGLSYDVLHGGLGAYHEQDLFRTGPAIWGVRGFVATPSAAGLGINYGLELRAGVRW